MQERIDAGLAGKYPFKYTYTVVKPNAQRLAIIADLIEHKKVHVHVSKIYPLEKARCAGCSHPRKLLSLCRACMLGMPSRAVCTFIMAAMQ